MKSPLTLVLPLGLSLVAGCSGHASSSSPRDGGTCEARACADSAADARSDTDAEKGDGGASEALDPTVAANLAYTSQFLYTGTNPVQTGVAAGTIDLTRASVIRGQVLVHSSGAGATSGLGPISGVDVTIVGHPEYGHTRTQSDGWFSMVVNGGGILTLGYASDGYLPVQRRAVTRWLEYAIANPAVLTAPEAGAKVTFSASSTTFQVVRGKTHGTAATMNATEDADGARTATILVAPGTTASVHGLNDAAITMRATECTTGSAGLQAMPADLPPTSAYTYAVDLSIDEAKGAPVTFSSPVLFYLENFIGFPVGNGTASTSVPAGYYDTSLAQWVPSTSGQVVKVLSNDGGTVTLDLDGKGEDAADSAFTPALVSGERAEIAKLYKAGTTFWRVGVPHFSWWDFNWGSGPPDGAVAPNNPPGDGDTPDNNSCKESGSIIECENQILGEQFPLVGTPFGLRYQSERTAGRQVSVQIPTTGATPLPSVVTGIEVLVETQGRQWNFHRDSLAANQFVTWTWDRKDAYGRLISGHSDVTVHVGYDYQTSSSYQETGSFGAFGNGSPITGNRALRQITIWQYSTIPVDQIDASTVFGLGGLSLTAQHLYDPFGQTFYGGDGTRHTVDGAHFTTINPYLPSTNAAHLTVGPDGTLYVSASHSVLAVDPKTQKYATVAGDGTSEDGTSGNPGNNKPATSVAVEPHGVALGPDGSLYVSTEYTKRVRRIDPSTGIITTIAGSGESAETCAAGSTCSDGKLATAVALADLGGVAVGPDGAVYFAEQCGMHSGRVRKIEADGTLTTVIDNLFNPDGIAFGPEGSLYVADTLNSVIKRLTPSGSLKVVAGGTSTYPGDGLPATEANLWYPDAVAVDDDGSFYISDGENENVRFVDTGGVMHSVTNSNARDEFLGGTLVIGDGGPAGAAGIAPFGLAIGPGHALYVTDTFTNAVRVIRPPLPGFSLADAIIPSADGSVVYQFDETGRHEQSFDAWKGQTLAKMAYDTSGFLSSLTDDAGNVTLFDHSDASKVVITAPFGQKTTIALDGSGYATSVTNPNDEKVSLTYKTAAGNENGLLATLTDPKGQVHTFQYTPVGLLSEDDNPAGGARKLVRSDSTSLGWKVTHTTRMGYVSSYVVSTPADGSFLRTATGPTGISAVYAEGTDGSQTSTSTDATGSPLQTTVVQLGPDPRYAMIAPIATSTTTTVQPSGLARTTTLARTVDVGSDFFDLKSQTDVVAVNPSGTTPQTLTTKYTAGSSSNTVKLTTTTGRTVTATLDTADRLTSIAIPGIAPTTFTYNTSACPGGGEGCGGRVTSVSSKSPSDGTRTWTPHYAYSPDTGFASSSANPLGQTVAWARDPVGRMRQAQLPDLPSTTDVQNQVHATYDLNGNLSTLTVPSTDASVPEHAFPIYDGEDLLKTYTPPALVPPLATTSTTYTYNYDSQLIAIQYPDDATYDTLGVGYDAVGRVHTVTDGKASVTRTYAYAPSGEPASVTTSDGETLGYGFGVDGPMLMSQTWSGAVAGSVAVTHDTFFRTASRSVNGGPSVDFAYDADGLYSGTTGLVALTLTRDSGGKNGLLAGSTLGSTADAYTYNGFGELKTYAASFSGTPLYSFGVTARDGVGRIKSLTETLSGTTHQWSFAYDAHGDLESSTEDGAATAYAFDPNGNRLSVAGALSTYDAQDRLLTSPGATYAYTNNGDLVTKTTSVGTTTYTYDLMSALRSVVLPNGDTVAYVIDGQGRRVGRTWTHGGQTVTQGFLYDDQLRIAAELDGAGNVVSTFVYGDKRNVPDAMVRGGTTYRIVSDWHGSVRAVVDTSAGTVVQTIDYDAWGNSTMSDTTCAAGDACAPVQPFGFAGGLYDRETELVRFGARDYDADIGRWTQKDVVRFLGGRNLYVYAQNDPINWLDDTGRDPYTSQYSSVPGAAYAALQQYNSESVHTTIELAGVIFENPNGTFSYTPGVNVPPPGFTGEWDPHSMSYSNPDDACGFPVAGGYHTHGGYSPGYQGTPEGSVAWDLFSGQDISAANSTGHPSYVGTPSGEIGTYLPSTGQTYYNRGFGDTTGGWQP